MTDLLRRAWDTLDTFKQAYPENWHEEDDRVLKDLMRADLRLSSVKLKWQGLTDEEVISLKMLGRDLEFVSMTALRRFARDIEAKLKDKNT